MMAPRSPAEPRAFTFRVPAPLDFARTLERHWRWGVDPANRWHDGALYRVARAAAGLVPFAVRAVGPGSRPRLALTFAGDDTAALRHTLRLQVERLVGATADLHGFYARVAEDPVLGPLVRLLPGLRPSIAPDPFEMLVGAICAQQVNLRFAFATRARLVRRFGEPTVLAGVRVHAFPTPRALAAARVETLRRMQFSARKAEYIIGLARAVAAGDLDLAGLATAPDGEVVARLMTVRGLGRWTAEWFLARGLGRPDACPADDLAVRRAVEALCFHGRPADAGRVRRRILAWRPYRSLAAHYLLAGASPFTPGEGPGRPGPDMTGPRPPRGGAAPHACEEVPVVGCCALGVRGLSLRWRDGQASRFDGAGLRARRLRAACAGGA